MANEDHIILLEKGVQDWNEWRLNNRHIVPDLRGAELSGAQLRDANLSRSNLHRADLSRAELVLADLSDADLTSANFADANLSGASLRHSNLSNSDLSGAELNSAIFEIAMLKSANLHEAQLRRADLRRADLSLAKLTGTNLTLSNLSGANIADADLTRTIMVGATVGFTTFASCDLSEIIGLNTLNHTGPSTVGVDTLYKSGGQIDESFLRDCGMPEAFVNEMRSLFVTTWHSCFISYSGSDEEFAKRLHGKMRDAHLRVWFAPEDIQGGKKLHEQIEMAIRVHDKLLIVLSQASLQSEWVMDELRKGFKAERETGKRKLFPVRLTDYQTLERWVCRDSASGKDLAEEIRQYFIPDFSRWKEHDHFEVAFSRLLKDLRAEAAPAPTA